MARKGKARPRPQPVIYPDTLRPPPKLPDAAAVLKMGLRLNEQEIEAIRVAMAIHTASKQPKLTWRGWQHRAIALDIGVKRARKASDGRLDTPDYRRVMGEFLRKTGFIFLNKDDRAAAVRMLPRWDEIDDWRSSLPPRRQGALNNPREVWRAYVEDRRKLGDPEARRRPAGGKRRQYPSLLEQAVALAEQLEMANERAERAERESEYFAEMMLAIAARAGLDDDAVAEIRKKVRAELASDEGDDTGNDPSTA